ncbi:dnaJ homolog subfamily C member 10-like [Diadema antillarum]|uniref:dnaJ homolog subfamily C member 10-like n=1 Tax=Diadema antillarum TaxID=105358 RepID=UPI003A8BECC2
MSARCCIVLCFLFAVFTHVAHMQEDEEENHAPKYLTKDEYSRLIESDQRFLVNFVSPGCVKCSEFAPEYEEVAKYFATEKADMDIETYIEGDLMTIRKQGLRRLPSVYYVRDHTPILYIGDMNAQAIINWVEVTGKRIHVTLTDETFEHLTQAATGATTGPWLVLFCDVSIQDCSTLLPMWEHIAYRLHSVINVALVDVAISPRLVKRFKLPESTPSVHLFQHGKRYEYNLHLRDDAAIVTFAYNGYKNARAVDVEKEPTPFDTLTENIADQLKEVLPEEHGSKILLAVPVVMLLLLVFFLCRGRAKSGLSGRTKKGV